MAALKKIITGIGKPRSSKCLRHLIVPGLLGIYSLFFVSLSRAQDLINTGTINNTGTFRVRNQVIGLPDTMGGVFEYFGGNQVVPASRYAFLQLTGSGTKTTSGGNLSVSGDVTIANAVTLGVEPGAAITLGGTLNELGYLTGSIQKTVDLSGGTTSSNFGNIGGTISWTSTPPGSTTLRRTSGTPITGNGNQSIKRYYDINAAVTSGLTTTFEFRYENRELNGQDSTKLLLWRSTNGGTTWINEGGTLDVAGRRITKTGIASLEGRWTAADSAHALGPFRVATTLAQVFGNNQVAVIGTQLPQPFVVRVTDNGGYPVAGHSVSFAIISVPSGAIGQRLSVTAGTTDDSGRVSTVLTLGSKVGVYGVEASATGLTGSPTAFGATATPGAASVLVQESGNNQTAPILDSLASPFVVTVFDTGGNVVPGASVDFAIASVPTGAMGQRLSAASSITDSAGRASSRLILGDKAGTYTVTAALPQTGSQAVFMAQALQPYPTTFVLHQNYPNPFNRGTVVRYEVPGDANTLRGVRIEAFNLVGQRVKVLVDRPHGAGRYSVAWDATDDNGLVLPTGIYFYRMVSLDYVSLKKMVFVK